MKDTKVEAWGIAVVVLPAESMTVVVGVVMVGTAMVGLGLGG